jgi:Domain of unknown function (DUF4386)
MKHAMVETSPRLKARIAGILYLIGPCGFAEGVRDRLTVDGDPAATASSILSHEQLFRWALVGDLAGIACYIVVLLLLYDLVRMVNRSVALLAVFFSLMAHTIQAAILVFHYVPLFLLKNGHILGAFKSDQLQALAYTSLELHDVGYNIDLMFFGCYCLAMGYLIFRSTYFPRILGVLMAFAGLSYLANSTLSFIAPALEDQLMPYILLPALGELVLALWLLVRGVNMGWWNEFHIGIQSGASP